jgi:hypothetical protein
MPEPRRTTSPRYCRVREKHIMGRYDWACFTAMRSQVLIIFRPAERFITGPCPPPLLAARFLAEVILPPLLFFAVLESPLESLFRFCLMFSSHPAFDRGRRRLLCTDRRRHNRPVVAHRKRFCDFMDWLRLFRSIRHQPMENCVTSYIPTQLLQ